MITGFFFSSWAFLKGLLATGSTLISLTSLSMAVLPGAVIVPLMVNQALLVDPESHPAMTTAIMAINPIQIQKAVGFI
jgi:hypothetical protein